MPCTVVSLATPSGWHAPITASLLYQVLPCVGPATLCCSTGCCMLVCAYPTAPQPQPLIVHCRGPGQQSVAADDDEDLQNPAMTFQSLEELPEPSEAAAAQEQEDAEHKVTEADKTGGARAG